MSKEIMSSENKIIKSKKDIEIEIQNCIKSLDKNFDNKDQAHFLRGCISSLEWVLEN